jgi:hypothetical protein
MIKETLSRIMRAKWVLLIFAGAMIAPQPLSYAYDVIAPAPEPYERSFEREEERGPLGLAVKNTVMSPYASLSVVLDVVNKQRIFYVNGKASGYWRRINTNEKTSKGEQVRIYELYLLSGNPKKPKEVICLRFKRGYAFYEVLLEETEIALEAQGFLARGYLMFGKQKITQTLDFRPKAGASKIEVEIAEQSAT